MKQKILCKALTILIFANLPVFLQRSMAFESIQSKQSSISNNANALLQVNADSYDSFQQVNNSETIGNKFLIAYQSNFKSALINVLEEEWNYFGRQTLRANQLLTQGVQETNSYASNRIEDYWDFLGYPYTGMNTEEAWSAAFISWAIHEAGDRVFQSVPFRYHRSHSVYIVDSIRNRKNGNTQAGFVGYQTNEYAPNYGDLVCYSRASFVTYDTTSRYSAHCDIIVSKRSNEIEVIGGNVRDSVSKKILSIDSNGMLSDQSYPWFVVIKNNI